MRIHPDDAALLDQLAFTPTHPCSYDGFSRHPDAPTVLYDGDWICREDLAYRLRLEREQAVDARQEQASTLSPAQ